jgi:hypothetical protein
MTEIVDVENYQMNRGSSVDTNIDQVLSNNNLFRLAAFSYTAGDCLFDAFQVLLHFRYSLVELHHGMVDHFLLFLHNGNIDALESFQYELGSEFLYQLHDIHDVGAYLSKMWLYASANQPENERGIWGDTFFIRWLANWINISITVWSVTRKRRYLIFNKNASRDLYCILFHDNNPLGGHYEPLLYKIYSICNFGRSNTYLSLVCKELEFHWKRRMQDMHSCGLDIATTSTTSCGESLFTALCYLVMTKFDV